MSNFIGSHSGNGLMNPIRYHCWVFVLDDDRWGVNN